jgi:hypothetical protein
VVKLLSEIVVDVSTALETSYHVLFHNQLPLDKKLVHPLKGNASQLTKLLGINDELRVKFTLLDFENTSTEEIKELLKKTKRFLPELKAVSKKYVNAGIELEAVYPDDTGKYFSVFEKQIKDAAQDIKTGLRGIKIPPEYIIEKGAELMEWYSQILVAANYHDNAPHPLTSKDDDKLNIFIKAARGNTNELTSYIKNPETINTPSFKNTIRATVDLLNIMDIIINPEYLKFGLDSELQRIANRNADKMAFNVKDTDVLFTNVEEKIRKYKEAAKVYLRSKQSSKEI